LEWILAPQLSGAFFVRIEIILQTDVMAIKMQLHLRKRRNPAGLRRKQIVDIHVDRDYWRGGDIDVLEKSDPRSWIN